jgi:hypothetical protein
MAATRSVLPRYAQHLFRHPFWERNDPVCRQFPMGRAGFEPATLGLKVRLGDLQRAARNGKILQVGAFSHATNCYKLPTAETSPYAHGTRTR